MTLAYVYIQRTQYIKYSLKGIYMYAQCNAIVILKIVCRNKKSLTM